MERELKEKIIKTASELLKNDLGYYDDILEYFIDDFTKLEEDTHLQDLLYILQYIVNDGYDITGYEIYEIPVPGVYIFFHKEKRHMFDIYIGNDMLVYAAYIRKNIHNGYESIPASSISEAVAKYDKEFCTEA